MHLDITCKPNCAGQLVTSKVLDVSVSYEIGGGILDCDQQNSVEPTRTVKVMHLELFPVTY